MLLIRRAKSKGKYQNGSLTSVISPKKLAQKSHILALYRDSHSEDLRILDLRSISIGFPTVKMFPFGTTFGGGPKKCVLVVLETIELINQPEHCVRLLFRSWGIA